MRNETNQQELISRRTLLASMGMTGAMLASGSLMQSVYGKQPVTDSVYGTVYGNGSGSGKVKVPDLLEMNFVIATTIAALRAEHVPREGYVYMVTDVGREGCYQYDPSDHTSADDEHAVLVSAAQHRFKRMAGTLQTPALLQSPPIAAMEHVSGSTAHTTGGISSGSQTLTVASPEDFAVGQGILVAGAGNAQREVVSLVIESEAAAAGTVTVQLPGESAQTVQVTATKEQVQLRMTAGCSVSGHIALLLDTVEFLIPVEAGETPVQIADRIRGWYFEGWANSGGSGTDTVTFVAVNPGKRRESLFYGLDTAVAATMTMTKGALTTARQIIATLKGRTYANWTTGGYNNATVLFFISKAAEARQGELASVQFGTTGAQGRIEVVQYGSFLRTTIAAIDGQTITLQDTAKSTVAGVYVGHDDTAALQDALNEAEGRLLALPRGTYRVSSKLSVRHGTRIVGEGALQTILQFQALKSYVEIGDGMHGVHIQDVQIRNVCAPDAYYGGDAEVHGIRINGAHDVVIAHCRLDNCDDGGIRVSYGNVNSRRTRLLYNTVVYASEGSGIEVIRGEDSLLIGNMIRYASQHAVRLCGARRPIAIGNMLEENTDGFSIQGFGDGRNVTQRTQDFVLEGNVIQDQVGAAISVFNQSNSGLIRGNWMEGTRGQTGVDFKHIVINGRASTNFEVVVEGNMVKGFQRAIQIRGDQHGIVIRNNMIKDFANDGTASAYGIYLSGDDVGDLKDISIEGNTFQCKTMNKIGVRMFKASWKSNVRVHNNTFYLRLSDLSPANVAKYSVLNNYSGGYSPAALLHTKQGICTVVNADYSTSTGTTSIDTNEYIGLLAVQTSTARIFIAGDSTAASYAANLAPLTGWGQVFQPFFAAGVTVYNHAASGRSSKSFIHEGRLAAILQNIRQGDYLFIQFGHNDQKTDEARHTDPATTFPQYLRQYVDGARQAGAIPVLVTSMERRRFNTVGEVVPTHGDYPAAVLTLAQTMSVPVIDLCTRSKALYAQLGEAGTKELFLWLEPGEHPNYPEGSSDDTHFNTYGAGEMAKLVIAGMRDLNLPLCQLLLP